MMQKLTFPQLQKLTFSQSQKLLFSLGFILLLISMLATMNLPSFAAPSSAETEAVRLWQLYESASVSDSKLLGETQKALKYYPLAQNKSSIEILAVSGLCSLNLKKYKDAEATGLSILKYDPSYVMGPYLVGSAQVGLKQYASAEKQLLKALTLDSTFAGTYVSLGELSIKNKKYNAAAKYYRQSAVLNPSLNTPSVSGYQDKTTYINPMLAFKLTLTKKDVYSTLTNDIRINSGTADEAILQIQSVIYDQVEDSPQSKDLAQMLISQSDPSVSTQHSPTKSITLGNETFWTFTSNEIIDSIPYRSQTYILSKDGVVTRLTLFAKTDVGFSSAQKMVSSYTRLK